MSLLRRDPRAERIARNRLHPEHVSATPQPTLGPTGLARKNPRAAAFMGPNGLKRIDRSGVQGPASATRSIRQDTAQTVELELPLHQVTDPDYYVVAVLDMVGGRLTRHDKDILGQGHQLIQQGPERGAVVAVVFGEHKEHDFAAAGVDRLLWLNDPDYQTYCPEVQLDALAALDADLQPRFWLFPQSPNGGTDLGLRLAAKLRERPATHAWQVGLEHTQCRGGSARVDVLRATPRVLILAEECALPIDETRHEVLPLAPPEVADSDRKLVDSGLVAVDPSQIPLAEAEFILAAGNGIQDWAQFHHVAATLGATEGASRVAVDDGHMPRARQVGASGTWVTARVYIAVGISGAVQHLQGIGQCDKVVAINLDPSCDMVKRADLSVIGDSQVVLQALLEQYSSTESTAQAEATDPAPDHRRTSDIELGATQA